MARIAIVLHGVLGEGDFPNSRFLETSGNVKTGIVARRDILLGYIKATAEYWP